MRAIANEYEELVFGVYFGFLYKRRLILFNRNSRFSIMKRLFARNSLAHTKDTRAAANSLVISAGQQRQFASSPQKNPYGSILTKLSVGSNQFSYYKLPALGDKRIGKIPLLTSI